MTRQDTLEDSATSDQVAESRANLEALEAAAEDAEAGAASVLAQLSNARDQVATLEGDLADAKSAEGSAAAEASQLRGQLDAARSQAREAAAKYREARLAAAPEVPPELVAQSDDIAEIDRSFLAAQDLVGQIRERVEEESQAFARSTRVPVGAPGRRAPDISSLSASEKIRMGLERLADPGR